MTKLPERNILDGSKMPRTTTGELTEAFGRVRDYLFELLGEDSSNKEAARLALGIDLAELTTTIGEKADQQDVERAMEEKADKSAVDTKADKAQLSRYLPLTGGVISGKLSVASALEVAPENSTIEGGEIRLMGAGSNSRINIDNYGGIFRIFGGPVVGQELQYTPATGTLSIGGFPVRYVSLSGHGGGGWWRKWSDGWIEQSSVAGLARSGTAVNFLIPFVEEPMVLLTLIGGYVTDAAVVDGITRTGFTGYAVDWGCRWYACGQGA